MSAPDFNEFEPNGDYGTWKKLVLKELGEKDYESLIWHNENGFDTEPNYTEITRIADIKRPSQWEMCQEVSHNSHDGLNKQLLEALMGGCNAIGIGTELTSAEAFNKTLNAIEWPYISIHFRQCSDPAKLLGFIIQFCADKNWDSLKLSGSAGCDAFQLTDEALLKVAKIWQQHFRLFRIFEIDVASVHERGGNAKQELAFAIAAGNEILHRLVTLGISPDDAAAMIQFKMASGHAYFQEIAKFRSMRLMWRTIVEAYGPSHECSGECFIYATTSPFLQTSLDVNNNLLRNVTQSMSAIIGGANALTVLPHRQGVDYDSADALRLARNIQQLLVEETHLDKHGDVARGTHYIEKMTEQLTVVAWQLFQDIEKSGGITNYLPTLNEAIQQNYNQLSEDVKSGKRIVVGVNKYRQNSAKASNVREGTLTGFLERE